MANGSPNNQSSACSTEVVSWMDPLRCCCAQLQCSSINLHIARENTMKIEIVVVLEAHKEQMGYPRRCRLKLIRGSLSISGAHFTLLYLTNGGMYDANSVDKQTGLHASCSTKTKPDSRTSSAAPKWRPPWAPCMAAACDRTTASWAPRPLPWWRLRPVTAAVMQRSAALPLAAAASPPTWAATSRRSPSLHLDPPIFLTRSQEAKRAPQTLANCSQRWHKCHNLMQKQLRAPQVIDI